MLRTARRDAGLTLAQLAARIGFSESYLSRVTNARELPGKDVTEAFAKGCGVDDLEPWRAAWEEANRRHQEIKSTATPAAGTDVAPARKPAADRPSADQQARPLIAFLRQVETKEQLIVAIKRLAARSGQASLREIAAQTEIPKSTIRDWLAGDRRPTRLDELVLGLGATPAEQQQFAQSLERVWSEKPPVVIFGSGQYVYSPTAGWCYEVTGVLYDRNVSSGRARLDAEHLTGGLRGIVGLSLGHKDKKLRWIVDLPATKRRSMISIGIWVTSPEAVANREFAVTLDLQTSEKSWPVQIPVSLPASGSVQSGTTGLPTVPPLSATAPTERTQASIAAEVAALRQAKTAAAITSAWASRASGLTTPDGGRTPAGPAADRDLVAATAVQPADEPTSADYRPRHRRPGRAVGLIKRRNPRQAP